MKTQTPKLFIQLSTGTISFDNSTKRNTQRFRTHDFKFLVRPHLIQSIQAGVIRNVGEEPLHYSELYISGVNHAVLSLDSPEEIMKMIEAIELQASTFVGDIGEELIALACSHDAMAVNTNGVSVCQYCGKEFIRCR